MTYCDYSSLHYHTHTHTCCKSKVIWRARSMSSIIENQSITCPWSALLLMIIRRTHTTTHHFMLSIYCNCVSESFTDCNTFTALCVRVSLSAINTLLASHSVCEQTQTQSLIESLTSAHTHTHCHLNGCSVR